MQGNEIQFSILVPVYNVEKYLEDCIQSVLKQTYSNYELILVDDGSKDNSGIICDKYAGIYSNIKAFHKANRGLIHTRRFALRKAAGEYIVMLDSDDLLEANTLEVLAGTISKHDCDCVFFNRKQLINGKIVRASYHIEEGYHCDKRSILRKALIDMPYNGIVLKCSRTSLYTDADYSNYYHIQRGEDLLQTLELLNNCNTAEFIDDELYIYRYRSESIANSKTSQDYTIDFTVRQLALQFVNETKVFTLQDYNEYRDKCIGILINQIISIALLNIPFKDKKKIFISVRNSKYYLEFLSKGITNRKKIGRKSIIFDLFKIGFDSLVVSSIRIAKHL